VLLRCSAVYLPSCLAAKQASRLVSQLSGLPTFYPGHRRKLSLYPFSSPQAQPNRPNEPVKITCFEDIEAWQEARKLVNLVYEAINGSKGFSKDFRLTNQIQGAAISTMANIAEGFSRRSDKEFVQFLFISKASAAEVQSHLYVALDQSYVTREAFQRVYDQAEKVSKMISGFIKYLIKP